MVTSTVSPQKLQMGFFAFSQADVRMEVQWEAEAVRVRRKYSLRRGGSTK